MDKFTMEELNLMCVFEGQDRKGMTADIKNIIPRIQDNDTPNTYKPAKCKMDVDLLKVLLIPYKTAQV